MQKISDAVRVIIQGNVFLEFGLHHRLLNLSQLARFLTPLVEARTKKEVQPSAILMCLSRFGRERVDGVPGLSNFQVENITVQSELCVLTLPNSREVHQGVTALYQRVHKRGGYITITEGINEITVILEKRDREHAAEVFKGKLAFAHTDVAAVAVKFDPQYLQRPGFLYLILQQVALQNVNIVELASTATEFILYVAERDVRLVFDTLYHSFGGGREQRALG